MRFRHVLLAALSVLLLTPALAAGTTKPGSKTEAGGAHQYGIGSTKAAHSTPNPFHGWDWVGRVSLGFYPAAPRYQSPAAIAAFRFANECNRAGTRFTGLYIPVNGRTKTFHYHGGGLLITGNVIGSLEHPLEITGVASMRLRGCASGPWWFDAYPGAG
jgi:hypothetical protein